MVIESRTIFGAATALALVGAVLWGSALLFAPPATQDPNGSVEIAQVPERAWSVEIRDLGAADAAEPVRTAANH